MSGTAVYEHHHAQNVAELFKKFAAKCSINSKMKAVIKDDACNMTSVIAHTLQSRHRMFGAVLYESL